MPKSKANFSVVNDELIDWVIREEGFLNKPTDIGDGKVTIGSGLTDPKWIEKYKKKGYWSKEDNRKAVAEELQKRSDWAEDTLPNWGTLPLNAKRAMLSYKYNYDFTRDNSPKLFGAMENGNFVEAIRQMDATSKNPKFKKGLQARREREQQWGLQGLFDRPSSDRKYEYPDATTVVNPYTAKIQNITFTDQAVPTNPSDNLIEAEKVSAEVNEYDKVRRALDAQAAFRRLIQDNAWENQEPKKYVPSSGINYIVDPYAEGGNLNKNKLWDELSMKEKAGMMRVAIENGITSLSEIKDKYNEFAEGGDTKEDVILPGQEGFVYNGPTYRELKQQIDPMLYNEISRQAAMRNNPTKEIVSYRDINGNTQEALNTKAGVLSPVDPLGEFYVAGKGVEPLFKPLMTSIVKKSAYKTLSDNSSSIVSNLVKSNDKSMVQNARQDIIDFVNNKSYLDRLQNAGLEHRWDYIKNLVSSRANEVPIIENKTLPHNKWGISAVHRITGKGRIEYNPNYKGVEKVIDHELAHYTTKDAGPSTGIMNSIRKFLGKENVSDFLKYDKEIAPVKKYSEVNKIYSRGRYDYITDPQEIRARAYATLNDANRWGLSIDSYLSNPSIWSDETKILNKVFTSDNLKKYMKNFLSVSVPVSITHSNNTSNNE